MRHPKRYDGGVEVGTDGANLMRRAIESAAALPKPADPVTPDLTAEVAEVLEAHRQTSGFDEVGDYFKYACTCSWSGHSDADHRAHVAAEVTNAVVTALGRPEVVEAVRAHVCKAGGDPDLGDAFHRHAVETHLAKAAFDGLAEALGAGTAKRAVVCVEASACYVDISGNNHHAVRCPKFLATDERTPR